MENRTGNPGERYKAPTEDCNGGVELARLETNLIDAEAQKEAKEKTSKEHVRIRKLSLLPCLRRRTNLERYLIILCFLMLCACVAFMIIAVVRSSEKTVKSKQDSEICLTSHCVQTASQLMAAMDQSTDPCEDFFQYACGTWNKKHIIPEDRPSFNTFEKLHDDLQVTLKGLLEEPSNIHDSNSTLQAKILYKSCINTTQIEKAGDEPLRKVLRQLRGWPVVTDKWQAASWTLEETLANMRGIYNAPILIDSWVGADDKNSTANILQIDQPNLGMPSREYFLKDRDSDYVQAYLKYMVNVAVLLGATREFATSEMNAVLEFEIQMANVSIPQAERHDTGKMYKKLTISELQRHVPKINWLLYFQGFIPTKMTGDEQIVSLAMEYLKDMSDVVTSTPKRVIANYLLWRLILGLAPEMTEKFQKERNEYRKVLQGVSRDKIRWQKCVEYVSERMGMSVGRMFIQDNFKRESKETALEMIHNIREAFNELLEENDWMDDETRAVAREKANAMNERIGYPEFITNITELDKTYESLNFHEDQYFENILQVERFDSLKNLKKLRQPVKKDKWEQDPAVVNAFYNPNFNDIVFPAGILQPLFYSQYFPKSLNYGGIGVVIGHEITHGFDDKGRQYDKNGNMKQWWKNETINAFRKRAQCMIDQYSNYTLWQIGLNIDGKNTQGENIADNGGLKESFRAYRKWVKKNGEEPLLPGINLTHNQLFFLNYAQIWCGKMRDEEALQKIRTSVHSPGPIRVLGPLSNSHEFSAAYSCPLGSKMNPVKKCSVW